MNQIDSNILLQQWNNLRDKLDQLACIPALRAIEDMGKEFSKMEIDDDGVTYHTETYFSGCGTDTYSFYVPWTEINQPVSYFEEKYNKRLEERNKAAEEKKNAELEKQKQKDLAEFMRLKEKLQM